MNVDGPCTAVKNSISTVEELFLKIQINGPENMPIGSFQPLSTCTCFFPSGGKDSVNDGFEALSNTFNASSIFFLTKTTTQFVFKLKEFLLKPFTAK